MCVFPLRQEKKYLNYGQDYSFTCHLTTGCALAFLRHCFWWLTPSSGSWNPKIGCHLPNLQVCLFHIDLSGLSRLNNTGWWWLVIRNRDDIVRWSSNDFLLLEVIIILLRSDCRLCGLRSCKPITSKSIFRTWRWTKLFRLESKRHFILFWETYNWPGFCATFACIHPRPGYSDVAHWFLNHFTRTAKDHKECGEPPADSDWIQTSSMILL